MIIVLQTLGIMVVIFAGCVATWCLGVDGTLTYVNIILEEYNINIRFHRDGCNIKYQHIK